MAAPQEINADTLAFWNGSGGDGLGGATRAHRGAVGGVTGQQRSSGPPSLPSTRRSRRMRMAQACDCPARVVDQQHGLNERTTLLTRHLRESAFARCGEGLCPLPCQ
jgi:hypothetical protein